MKCKGCRDPYATFIESGYALSNFPIDDARPDRYGSYVIDRTYLCKLCGYQGVHGIAVSKEHFNQIAEWTAENGGSNIVGKVPLC